MGAIAGAFFLSGLVFGTWAARVPAIKTSLDLGPGALSAAFAAMNAGAIIGLHAGARLVGRFGSRATLRSALPAFGLLLPFIGAAPNLPFLAAALAVSAWVNSVVDVAINANGSGLERQCGRAVLSRLHAMLTLGGVAGAAGGVPAAWLTDGVLLPFTVVGTASALAAAVGMRWLDDPAAAPTAAAHRPDSTSRTGWPLAIGALAFCVTLAEGGANDWAALYLHETGAGHALAAGGTATFLAAMTIGRLAGDHLRTRLGPVRLFRVAALLAATGLCVALLAHQPLASLAGFALLGLGLSVTLPIAIGTATHQAVRDGRPPAVAVARVSALAYFGAFAGPALIGAIAAVSSLGTGLLVAVILLTAAALTCGPILDGHKQQFPTQPAHTIERAQPPT
jgi:hypothetical protein